MAAPHPPLKEYYPSEAERSLWVRRLFDRTAADYDRIEHAMALGSGSWYRRRALARAGLGLGQRVIDVGTGTGLTAVQAAALVGDPGLVTGIDPCPGMVGSAKVPAGLAMLIGSAESIPLPSAVADFLTMGYALRHVADLGAALREFSRVLVPGGRICLLEITRPEGPVARGLLKAYMRMYVPLLARFLGRHPDTPALMRYYWDTIEACAPPESILRQIAAAGFEAGVRRVELGIFSEYCARKPLH
jgi:demethylmenaquinone methyltransferase/2-methoxy-6-polyprenyl-1,4-benzoquinol methylase